mgnify:FL=1
MDFNYKTQPYEHQHEALVRSHDKVNYAYFMEMGCGKSKVLIDNIVWLYEQGHIDTAVIVAPKGVYRNWEVNEIPIHFPDNVHKEIYVWRSGANKSQLKRLEQGIVEREPLRILLINVEAFATQKLPKYLKAFVTDSSFLSAVD